LEEKKELVLTLSQTLKCREQERYIVFLLPFDDGRRMLAR
jgi:hypothetical protein